MKKNCLSILLCLTLLLSLFPTAGLAAVALPTVTVELPITKIVEQNGTQIPGEQTFTFELSGLSPNVEYSETSFEISTKGVASYKENFEFTMTAETEEDLLAALQNGFYISEKAVDGWTQSTEGWFVLPMGYLNDATGEMSSVVTSFYFYDLSKVEDPSNPTKSSDAYSREMTFTNTYDGNPTTTKLTGVSLNYSTLSIGVGDTLTLKATISGTCDRDDVSFTWTSSNSSVAFIISDDGEGEYTAKIMGKNTGTATITCTAEYGGSCYCNTCKVTVEDDDDDFYIKTDLPSSYTAVAGVSSNISFTVTNNTGYDTMYQWYVDGSKVNSGSKNSFNTTNLSVGSHKVYCIATANDGNYQVATSVCNITVIGNSQSPSISIPSTRANLRTGNQVTLPVTIQNNPGIAGVDLALSIPEPLTLTSVSMGQLPADAELGNLTWNEDNNYILWTSPENLYGDGTILLLTLQIPEDCPLGDYEIGLSTPAGHSIPFTDEDQTTLSISVSGCTLDVCNFTPGDVDEDGDITAADAVALALHIVEKKILTGSAFHAADMDADKEITVKDAVILLQWLANETDLEEESSDAQ